MDSRLNSIQRAMQSSVMHETSMRCSEGIHRATESLVRANEVSQLGAEELVASELRLALVELSAIIGEVHTEDILGEIFGRFCIGK